MKFFKKIFLFGLPENSWCALRIQGKTSSLTLVAFPICEFETSAAY